MGELGVGLGASVVAPSFCAAQMTWGLASGLFVWGRSGYEGEHYEEITTVLLQPRAVVSLLHHSR